MGFTISSAAFAQGSAIPREYGCEGGDESPELSWSDPPAGTESYALVCEDPDAPGGLFVHWLIYTIPGSARGLPRAVKPAAKLPDGSAQGRNDFGNLGYGGPCPPHGKPHRYFFRLFALKAHAPLAPGLGRKELLRAIEAAALAKVEVFGTCKR
jgi:Raf kinase inhibitor-like YbhB/YbcL family protein